MLEIKDLSVVFSMGSGLLTVADRIGFLLTAGETLAIVGESGSGKSVTALSIMRLLPEAARIANGSMIFSGKGSGVVDLATESEEKLQDIRGAGIAMVFQEPMTSLNPVMTCGRQVSETLLHHRSLNAKTAREKVLALFAEVKLPDPARIFRSYPHQLSGGQKQRVMIAMAIACDPAVLIADEPTTALDVTVQKAILDLLKNLQKKRGMAILFITHDLGLVAGFADRVLVMKQGRVVEEGTVKNIFTNPVHPYTRGLLACRPPAGIRPRRLMTVEQFLRVDGAEGIDPETDGEREARLGDLYRQNPVLAVETVSKRFGGFHALNPTSFKIWPGETLGIVGESGSGKTTLARVILELIPPTAGRIFYNDTDITRLTTSGLRKLRKDLQIIFQDPYSALNPRKAIGPAILEPMKVHRLHGSDRARKERVLELLKLVGLDPAHFYRFPHEFSGGQRQRVCIARALAVEPRLIICDESVSALDVSIQAQILNLLNDLKRDFGLTYIFISHDLSVVRYMSDRIIVMRNGSIAETGDADELYSNPGTPYTRELLAAMPAGFSR